MTGAGVDPEHHRRATSNGRRSGPLPWRGATGHQPPAEPPAEPPPDPQVGESSPKTPAALDHVKTLQSNDA